MEDYFYFACSKHMKALWNWTSLSFRSSFLFPTIFTMFSTRREMG